MTLAPCSLPLAPYPFPLAPCPLLLAPFVKVALNISYEGRLIR